VGHVELLRFDVQHDPQSQTNGNEQTAYFVQVRVTSWIVLFSNSMALCRR